MDGSIMAVLDSGAEASVIVDRDLIPIPTGVPMPVVSFNGIESCCDTTGECIACIKTVGGKNQYMNLGHAGVLSSVGKDNLLSVPTLRKMGFQFWFGDHPICVTPHGQELPLYMSESGLLALCLHTSSNYGFDPKPFIQTRAHRVGFLSNDHDL